LAREPELLREIGPRKFEEVVAELLSRQGYEVQLTPSSRDGGFDIYAAKKEGLGQFLYLVECKRLVPPRKVGVGVVRSLYGTVQSRRATAGVVVTTSHFTSDAQDYRRSLRYQIQLHDFVTLRRWLAEWGAKRC
jgi:restriction system protein